MVKGWSTIITKEPEESPAGSDDNVKEQCRQLATRADTVMRSVIAALRNEVQQMMSQRDEFLSI